MPNLLYIDVKFQGGAPFQWVTLSMNWDAGTFFGNQQELDDSKSAAIPKDIKDTF